MSSYDIVGDVGGTNARLALVKDGEIIGIRKYLCQDFASLNDAIEQFKTDSQADYFTSACIAVACPANHDLVKFTNNQWSFSQQQLAKAQQFKELFVINDFTAVAFSLPKLLPEQIIQIGSGTIDDKGNIAVFGPGTGLGVEHLTWTGQAWQTLNGEGGHVDFAPNDEIDIVIWRYLLKKHGRASAEEVLSGRGIVNIYNALCEDAGKDIVHTDPADITESALSNTDEIAVKTLQQFCRVMGAFAGNLALNLCTTGGVFIGGGITAKLGSFFINSDFRKYFESKGALAHYVKPIPTFLINEPDHGLIGALAYLTQQTQSTHHE